MVAEASLQTAVGDDRQAVPQEAHGARDLIIILAFAILGGLLIAGSSGVFNDGDVSWHIAAGEWMLDHRAIPLVDPFSFSAPGQRWIAHEWLSELLMAIVYRFGGFAGVGILTLAAVISTLSIAGLWMRRWASPVELGVVLFLMFVGLGPFVQARPMVLAWPLLCIWTIVLLEARERGSRPPAWWTIILMLVWVNLHASWAIGLLLAGAFGLEAVLASGDRLQVAGRWAAYGAALFVAALINPNFLHTLIVPIQALTSGSIIAVQEFRPTDFAVTPAFEIILLLVLGVGWWRGAHLGFARTATMLALLHLALMHMRHQTLFIIVGAFILVPPLTRRWNVRLRAKPGLADALGLGERGIALLSAGAGLLFMVVAGARLMHPFEPAESPMNPVHGFAAIPAELRTQPVLNEYSLGGPMILRGIRPFIDGRGGDVYGNQFFVDYLKIRNGDPAAFAKADQRWHFGWIMTSPANVQLRQLLDHSPDWRRYYADRFTVVHVRKAKTDV